MVILPDGSEALFDSNGTLRMRIGDLTKDICMSELFHITKDGQYVDGVDMSKPDAYSTVHYSQIRNTYEGCHAWCKSGETWFDTPAVAVGFARWDTSAEADVPECVRMAEILR